MLILLHMADWYESIYKGLIMASVVAFIIGFFSQGAVSIDAYITGYSVLTLGIVMLLILLFNGILGVLQNAPAMQQIYAILMNTGPFLLMLGVIGFILYMLIIYKANIVDNRVAQGYYSFSNITIILILLQLFIVYTNITDNKFQQTGKLSKVTSSALYLLGVLSAISSMTLFTILKYFTTDGFRV